MECPSVHFVISHSSHRVFYSVLLELNGSTYFEFDNLYLMKSFHIYSYLFLIIVLENRSCYSHLQMRKLRLKEAKQFTRGY